MRMEDPQILGYCRQITLGSYIPTYIGYTCISTYIQRMGCAVQDWDCLLDVTNRSEEQVFRKLKRSVSAYRAGYFTFF